MGDESFLTEGFLNASSESIVRERNRSLLPPPPPPPPPPAPTPPDDTSGKRAWTLLREAQPEVTNRRIRFILSVYSTKAWKLLILFDLLTSYTLSFWVFAYTDIEVRGRGMCVAFLLNSIFAVDVAVVIGLKFVKKWRKTLNLVEPKTWRVVLDTVIAMPYSLLYLFEATADYRFLIPLSALIRCYRIFDYFLQESRRNAARDRWGNFLFQYLTLFFLAVHALSCIWYMFAYDGFDIEGLTDSWTYGTSHLPTETTLDWYLLCSYWSVMLLTTNALGDLYPRTTAERLVACAAVVLGFTLTTIMYVGSLTSLFVHITTRKANYVRKLKSIQNHLKLIEMDADTTKKIISHYEALWYQQSGVLQPHFLSLLPRPLQLDLSEERCGDALRSSLLLRSLSPALLRRLAHGMTQRFFLKDDVVFRRGHIKPAMVCITQGVLQLLSVEDDESPMISLVAGTCFGEVALIYNIPACCTVKAATYSECQILEKSELVRVMVTCPEVHDALRHAMRARVARRRAREFVLVARGGDTDDIRHECTVKVLKKRLRYMEDLKRVEKKRKEEGKRDGEEDETEENCLYLYSTSQEVERRTPWVLEPDGSLAVFWELYMLAVVLYLSIVYPYFIGFTRGFGEPAFYQIDTVICVSLVFNVVVDCVTAVVRDNLRIAGVRNIIRYRLRTFGFYMDLVAILPLENLVMLEDVPGERCAYRKQLFNLCKGTKLCLVWRFSSLFEKLERKLLVNDVATKIWKYTVLVLLGCYWSGVLLYTEACLTKTCASTSWFVKTRREDLASPYRGERRTDSPQIAAVYFASSILTSVAYGDFAPGDHYDMAAVAFLSLFATLMVGYFIAEFSAVITHSTRAKTSFVEVMVTTEKFLEAKYFPRALIDRITGYFELQWQYNSGADVTGESWLLEAVVPAELRMRVLRKTRFRALMAEPFFRINNKPFLDALLERTKEVVLPPGEVVQHPGSPARALIIVDSGICLASDVRGHRQSELGPGSSVGLLTMLYGVSDSLRITTVTHCKLISLDYESFRAVCSRFPDACEYSGLLRDEEWQLLAAYEPHAPVHTLYARRRQQTISALQGIRNVLQSSVINVYDKYEEDGEGYWQSFSQFGVLGRLAAFVLLPGCLRPDGPLLRVWTLLRTAAAYTLILLTPINVALDPDNYIKEVLIGCDVVSLMDMFLLFYVGTYGDKNQLIYHPYLTARKYLQGPFLVDLVTCFPWHILNVLLSSSSYHPPFGFYWQLFGLLQIYKTLAAFWAESTYSLKAGYALNVVKFVLQTLFQLVLYACVVILTSCTHVRALTVKEFVQQRAQLSLTEPYVDLPFQVGHNFVCREGSWLAFGGITEYRLSEVFLLSLYWSASSLSGSGIGNATPRHASNLLLATAATLQGSFFFGYVYASIAALKAVADQGLMLFRENMNQLQQFLEREQVPAQLVFELQEYWKFRWKRTGGWSHRSVLSKLPPTLREDALLFLYEETLREMPLFEHAGGSFFRAFVKHLREQYYMRGYTVMRSDEVTSLLYIVYRGKVDVLSDSNEMEACLGMGGMFGNIGGAPQYRALSSVIASRNTQLLCMDGSQFYKILQIFPAVLRKVENCTRRAAKDYMLPTTTHQTSLQYSTDIAESDSEEDGDSDSAMLNESGSMRRSTVESYGSRSAMSLFGNNPHFVRAAFLIFKPHKWFRCSILPDDKVVVHLDWIILILSYVDFMLTAYQLAFLTVPYYKYACVSLDWVFVYKLFLDIHTGYVSKYGDYVLHPKRVRAKYFSNRWIRRRDLLANLPLCYLALALPLRNTTPAFSYLRLPLLLRITNFITYQRQRNNQLASASFALNIGFLALWASAMSYVLACLFFKLSCLTEQHCCQDTVHVHSSFLALWASAMSHVLACLFFKLSCLTEQNCCQDTVHVHSSFLALWASAMSHVLACLLFKLSCLTEQNCCQDTVHVHSSFLALWASAMSHVLACLFFKLSCLTEQHCCQDTVHVHSSFLALCASAMSHVLACLFFKLSCLTEQNCCQDTVHVHSSFLALWASAMSHVLACLFFKLSCLTEQHCCQVNWMEKDILDLRYDYNRGHYYSIYVTSLWYIMNLITITGTGDVSAQNGFEITETIIITIMIRFGIGLLISEISALMGLHSASRAAYERGVSELGGLRLSALRAARVHDYMRKLWARRRGQQVPVLLTTLPPALHASVLVAACGAHVTRCAVFAHVGTQMSRELARRLQTRVLFPGDYVVKAGDVDQSMYFVQRGEASPRFTYP